ncbi:MAG TPA: peptidase M15 family protein [Desulfobacterales bacterium]|nr:peptidase M15 family protein [Desulfobacterales bacterium]
MGDLSKHFSKQEFACPCGCGFDTPARGLIIRLELIREILSSPVVITSGCRCASYNKKIGGAPNSAHTRGCAADIHTPDSEFRWKFLQLAFILFKRVGIGKDFIHVDTDNLLPQEVAWTYGGR